MIDDKTLEKLSEIFKSIGDPTRLKIIFSLVNGEKSVTNISEDIQMGQSATSHQLRKLKDLKLIKSRKEGRQVLYSLDDDHVLELLIQGLDHVSHTWLNLFKSNFLFV